MDALGVSDNQHVYMLVNYDRMLSGYGAIESDLFSCMDEILSSGIAAPVSAGADGPVAEIDLEKAELKEEPIECIKQEPGQWDGGGIEGRHSHVRHDRSFGGVFSTGKCPGDEFGCDIGVDVGFGQIADLQSAQLANL